MIIALLAALQIVTAPAVLPDTNHDGRITINKVVTSPQVPKGTVLYPCGQIGGRFFYSTGACIGKPAAPAVATSTRTSTKVLSGAYSARGVALSGVGVGYRLNSGTLTGTFEDLTGTDLGLTFRGYGGRLENVSFNRIRSTEARHANGVGMGLILINNTKVSGLDIGNFYYSAAKPNDDPGDVPACIALAGKDTNDGGQDIHIHDGYCENIFAQYPAGIDQGENADGLAVEKTYSNVLVENVWINGCSDTGFDIKALLSRLSNVISQGCARGFKLWSANEHGDLFSVRPGHHGPWVKAHVNVMGGTRLSLDKPLFIRRLYAENDIKTPIFNAENAPVKVIVHFCDFHVPVGTPLLVTERSAKGSVVICETGGFQ